MRTMHPVSLILLCLLTTSSCKKEVVLQTEKWLPVEISFTSTSTYSNPYTDVDMWVEFSHSSGEKNTRPAFWYSGDTWKVRFASPREEGTWSFVSYCSNEQDAGLNRNRGTIHCRPYTGTNNLLQHGFPKMSPGKRNVIHSDGTPFIMIADTPWALPWRGTVESVTAYAKNRMERGFNAALLMTVQPDQDARGPDERDVEGGFGKGFFDLEKGHLNELHPEYFMLMDTLMNILIDHGIIPVYQPVFHGFGWKGLRVLGTEVDPDEYVRYQQYLLARYGAMPAFWLVSGDNNGLDPGVKEAGEYLEKWDDYQQPTGIHYNPMCDNQPEWAPEWKCFHYNRSHQEAEWLDFQWCQTGHAGIHDTHKVELMTENLPVKAVANGEPTYEGIRDPENGAGWWQGHEAWLQYMSGGTMGVVYGAGGLWNWKLFADEPGWADWCNSNVSWKEAIELPGSRYPGYLGKALKGLNTTDLVRHPELAEGRLCLAHPGELWIVYLPEGGEVNLTGISGQVTYAWFDPVNGEFTDRGTTEGSAFSAPQLPMVLIVEKI